MSWLGANHGLAELTDDEIQIVRRLMRSAEVRNDDFTLMQFRLVKRRRCRTEIAFELTFHDVTLIAGDCVASRLSLRKLEDAPEHSVDGSDPSTIVEATHSISANAMRSSCWED